MKEIKTTAIVGMGALGLLYGKKITDALGMDAVTYVMDEDRFRKYTKQTFSCNDEEAAFQMVCDKDASPTDLVIVAVKGTGLEKALTTMAGCVGPDTIIISVLNGISSEELLGARFGFDHLIYTVAQGMDAMKFGNALHYTRFGELRIGVTQTGLTENLEALTRFFDRIEMPYTVEADIRYRLWGKFMLNVGVNQTCMVYGTTYGGALAEGEANRTMIAAMREVIALANAEGIGLTEADLNQYVDLIGTLSPEGTPSMGQDRINRKPSEVELFAGTVIRLAEKHGLHVPTNRFLYQRAKEIEKGY